MKNVWYRYSRLFMILLLGFLSGCWLTQRESAGNGTKPIEFLSSGAYGSRSLPDPSATWISNRAALEQRYSTLNKHQLDNIKALPDIDFNTHGVLHLEMGQRPTGGYSIEFDPSQSRVIDDQAVIHVAWKAPSIGMTLTQAVTSPFILLTIQKTDLTSILVLDQEKQPLFELEIP